MIGYRQCVLALALSLTTAFAAQARVTKFTVVDDSLLDVPTFAPTGVYRKITGTFEGELDVANPRNAVIADLALAPRVKGKVRYRSTFYILRPLDDAKWNGKLFYMFGNRGLKLDLRLNDAADSLDPTTIADFGNAWLNQQGYALAWSGWDANVKPAPNMMSIDLPVARKAGGAVLTGKVAVEFTPPADRPGPLALPYPMAKGRQADGVLTAREHEADPRTPVTGWRWLDAGRIQVDGAMKPEWIYEFVYTARDPKVAGVGHAATRDFIAFLRTPGDDDAGAPNPMERRDGLDAVYSFGRSQGGRVQRDFLYWGFNASEDGKARVIDGMMVYSAGAGLMWMNQRFAQPSASRLQHLNHHAPEAQGPHTFQVAVDPLTGLTDGLFRRCQASATCPKVMSIDSSNEYWMKMSSLRHTDAAGNDLDVDALAPDARLYALAGTPHSSAFGDRARPLAACQQMSNPLYQGPIFRALLVAMDQWVTKGTEPPPSRVPTRAAGTLVPAEQVRFPNIPALSYAGYPALPAARLHSESMSRNFVQDYATVPSRDVAGKAYVALAPQADADGNELGGIRPPLLDAPLGTYTGWAILKPGMGAPDLCGQSGQFIPFAATRAERERAGDPRLSLEERYPTDADYRAKISAAVAALIRDRLVLPQDGASIVADAYEQYRNHRAEPGAAAR